MFDGNAWLSGSTEDDTWGSVLWKKHLFDHIPPNCISQWMRRPCTIQLSGVQVNEVQLLMNSDLINYHSHQLIDWVSVKLCSIFCNSLVGHLRVTICRLLERKESSVLFYSGDEGRANTASFQSRGLIWQKPDGDSYCSFGVPKWTTRF